MVPQIIFGEKKSGANQANLPKNSPFTPPIQILFAKYQASLSQKKLTEVSKIHVDELASKVAYLYERIIKIIDWKEENLLRRNAIERFLKRNFITEISKINVIFNINAAKISEPLIHELIRGGHLPNDEIDQAKIPLVQQVIEKYLFIIKNAPLSNSETFVFKKKRPLTNLVIILLYIFTCLVTFGGIAWIFYKVKIPLTSVFLDTIGIALNVFAAMAIRNKAKEVTVEEKSNFGEFLLDILFLPIAEIGSWLASKWREYNIVSVFVNVIIETPFLTFIDFIENWRQFLKEKKAAFH